MSKTRAISDTLMPFAAPIMVSRMRSPLTTEPILRRFGLVSASEATQASIIRHRRRDKT